MVKLQIDPRIPKEWRAPIEFLESIKDEKTAFVEEIINETQKGKKNPFGYITYLNGNMKSIFKKIENYVKMIDLAINRLDKIVNDDPRDIEVIQVNLMKQQAVLSNLKTDINFMLDQVAHYDFKQLYPEEATTLNALLEGILTSLKDMRRVIIQERGGVVQGQLIKAALKLKVA